MKEYKFRTWLTHTNGKSVTDDERAERAGEIASLLCSNSTWLSHGSHITREIAKERCRLKIVYPESIEGLDRAIRRFWALMRLVLENNPIAKIYATDGYYLFKSLSINANPTAK